METNIRPKLNRPTDILRQAWADYKEKFGIVFPIAILTLLPMFIFSFISAPLEQKRVWEAAELIWVPLGGIISALIVIWGQIAVVEAVATGSDISESFAKAKHKIFSYIWINILNSLIIAGGFILLVIPGIIFSLWFVFAQMVMIIEGQRGINALATSREYVRDYWLDIFFRLVFLLIVFIPFAIINGILQGIFQDIPIGILVSSLFVPLGSIYLYHLYLNLKSVKSMSGEMRVINKKWYIIGAVWGIIAALILAMLISLISVMGPW